MFGIKQDELNEKNKPQDNVQMLNVVEGSHTHQPVAEVKFVVTGDQRHGELVSPICVKYIKFLRGWRSHFIGAGP